MKAVEFAKIIKEIIKKEVRTVIREELREALGPKLSRTPQSVSEMFLAEPKPKPTTPIKPLTKTGNIGLDGILAETAYAVRNGQSAMIEDDYPNMGDMFTADQAQGFGYMMQDQSTPHTTTYSNPNDPTAAFMKDYSQILKVAEDIHNRKP